jgi:Tfp pilus assembly protein PilF
MDALGYGYYLVGNLIMAERFLYRALDAAPTDPLTQYHFALLNIAKEDVETARSALRITLELARDDSLALMAERALDRLGR